MTTYKKTIEHKAIIRKSSAGVLGEMLVATCETIAKARGNPFAPSPEG